MDKNAIKKFAVWARTELIARVSLKGVEYGITEGNIEDANVDSVGGKVLTADEKKQRQALIAEINDKGYKQVMEEVAYTWFNRFSALRFMEVNGYIPSHVRVFTDEENNFKPQIITEAIHLDLDGLDMEKVYELKDVKKATISEEEPQKVLDTFAKGQLLKQDYDGLAETYEVDGLTYQYTGTFPDLEAFSFLEKYAAFDDVNEENMSQDA